MKANDWKVRDFTPDDYEALNDIYTEVYPDHPKTVEELRDSDRRRNPKCRHHRWLATVAGQIVAEAYYNQQANKYDPETFYIGISVRETFRRRGIGSDLYNRILEGLRPYRPRLLRTHAREDRNYGIRFLEKRGYVEFRRETDSRLNVSTFDASPFSGLEARLEKEGIKIRTLRELESDPDRDRKLYDLDWDVTRDEPGAGDDSRVDFDTFVGEGLNAPWRLPDGYFVAVKDGDYIGLCLLNAVQADGGAHHGITGVKRRYRRLGIATALKVRAIAYARKAGIPYLMTENETSIEGMMAINRKLGYRQLPAWIFYEKGLTDL
jgi:GNAT superfamily N-acetyltransferase